MKVLLDTGPLVALLNRRDSFHRWSVEQAGRLKPPFHTCEAVLTEAHFLLAGVPMGRERLLQLTSSGRLDLSYSYQNHRSRVKDLLLQYGNVPISFADACLVSKAEELGGTVFTLDSDFHIYRKHRDQPLPAIMP
ncbi:MAG TPA: PIN domain-containing protein [Rhodothermales bacterium]|nr:PIN domain-containing protein [Rhodothermales bacterium]